MDRRTDHHYLNVLPVNSLMGRRRSSRWVIATALLAGIAVPPGHAQQTSRAKVLSERLMCMCGCNQVLGECNHVGCPMSGGMLKDLDKQVSAGGSDNLVLQSFVQEFGEKVLAEPPARGFNWLAWLMPVFVTLAGFAIVRAIMIRWRHPALATPPGSAPSNGHADGRSGDRSEEMLQRVRRESGLDD
jgi:cytochrome c-type biogenesis protein CcmH